ncbi:MAG: cob(I)yrinic acid a,c-diamide adenosyltransferase [Bacteroidia bacterium]
MKIYTKKGDQGFTSLIGGSKVQKSHIRINAYGTIDELNSFLGLVRDHTTGEQERAELYHIQNQLFTIGSLLASEPGKSKMKLPELKQSSIDMMEQAMDKMNEALPELTAFILPGGHPTGSYCHIARCVCRRAERLVVELNTHEPLIPLVIPFLNRLSDYLFVLARKMVHDAGGEEVQWEHE